MDIVRFKGGLGNQMFQYALLKSLSSQGRKVMASLGYYSKHPGERTFCLKDVFGNVSFEIVDEKKFEEIDGKWKDIKKNAIKLKEFRQDYVNRFFWVEDIYGAYNEGVFETRSCVFVGYWQTEKYFLKIRDTLLQDFQFSQGEDQLEVLRNELMDNNNYVSVHIRRGDYLNISELYGDLSSTEYYVKAMKLIQKKNKEAVFVFFSDDIGWVRDNYQFDGAIYIEPGLFKNYQPWYDMCLMSCCSHNIIANSSFSWWGAWLNRREGMIIAPKRWFRVFEMPDICPENWIRL